MELIKENLYVIRNKKIFSSNTYILKNSVNDDCIIIDPGFDINLINKDIKENNLKPLAIISTHGHFDHIGGATFFKIKYNIPFYLHEADLKIAKSANFYLKVAQLNHKIVTPTPDFLFKGEYEYLKIKEFEIQIFNLPGHSPGSCVLKIENLLFSGDILYKNGIGGFSIPKENIGLLKKSISKIFDIFNDEDLILPGHGAPEYIREIKKNNTELINFLYKNNE